MQHYKNHIRYYAPHHFVFYPLVLAFLIASGINIFKYPNDYLLWGALALAFLLIMWLAYMLRQHYALTVQNRVVRLEMRLRYFELTGKRFSELEKQLSFGQIAALRFASDGELLSLMQRTINENLPPATIKKAIKQWEPDHMRV